MVQSSPKSPEPVSTSPGPWLAISAATINGSVLIYDLNGDVIGYATDLAGHTTEQAPPDGRHPAETLRNGYRMAMAPEMLETLLEIVAFAPNRVRDENLHFRNAIERARGIISQDGAHALLAEQLVKMPVIREGASS